MQVQGKTRNLETALQRMESESPEAVRLRERGAFAAFAGPHQDQLILHGAGPLGRLVLQQLELIGLRPIAFTDNNQQLWHSDVGGIPVLPPSEASERYRDRACFVVTIYNGSRARRQLRELGCNYVAPFAVLFCNYPEVFTPAFGIDLPHNLPAFVEEIRACYDILSDEESRNELVAQIESRYWLTFDCLPNPLDPVGTYFPLDLVSPTEHEVFVDCGSFQGDILPSFISHWNSRFKHIYALEPDPSNREVLERITQKLGLTDRTTIMPYAIGERNEAVSFASTGTVTSQITKEGSISVECRRLDAIDWPLLPTYVKMDIEGAEPQAISGATDLLRRHQPVLAACTYHRSEHLWQIPNLIHSIAPEYKLFLRRYAEECWEGVCYAIPSQRLQI